MKKVFLFVVLMMLCAALLGGCYFDPAAYATPTPGGTGPSASVGPTPTASAMIEPDKLISKAEAETLVGNGLGDGEIDLNTAAGMKQCFYNGDSKKKEHFLQISVTQQALMPSPTMKPQTAFDALKGISPQSSSPKSSSSQTPTPTPQSSPSAVIAQVTGIGDDAYIANPGIHIMYKGYYISIAVGDPSIPANQDILKAAGKLAVENLQKMLTK
jgi:hypothetical protein